MILNSKQTYKVKKIDLYNSPLKLSTTSTEISTKNPY